MTIFIASGIQLKLRMFGHEIDTKNVPSTPPQKRAFFVPQIYGIFELLKCMVLDHQTEVVKIPLFFVYEYLTPLI